MEVCQKILELTRPTLEDGMHGKFEMTRLDVCAKCMKNKAGSGDGGVNYINFRRKWWTPDCKFWNFNNISSKKIKYGPSSQCPYILEHEVCDSKKFVITNKKDLRSIIKDVLSGTALVIRRNGGISVCFLNESIFYMNEHDVAKLMSFNKFKMYSDSLFVELSKGNMSRDVIYALSVERLSAYCDNIFSFKFKVTKNTRR